MVEIPQLTDQDFERIRELVHQRFGIYLSEQKRSLVLARLQKVVRRGGYGSFEAFYNHVINDTSGRALTTLINRISTNHTYFNREEQHFEFLVKEAVPFWLKRLGQTDSGERLRIWSAGCSSGEEPYQIAMELAEMLGPLEASQRVAILATDISKEVLERAVSGIYQEENVKKLKPAYVQKYFKSLGNGQYEVKPQIKKMILFRRLNLMRPEFPFKRRFHIVFCRNVMIYFDRPTKAQLLEKFHRYMETDGFFFVGHAESFGHRNTYFKYLKPAVYVRKSGNGSH